MAVAIPNKSKPATTLLTAGNPQMGQSRDAYLDAQVKVAGSMPGCPPFVYPFLIKDQGKRIKMCENPVVCLEEQSVPVDYFFLTAFLLAFEGLANSFSRRLRVRSMMISAYSWANFINSV